MKLNRMNRGICLSWANDRLAIGINFVRLKSVLTFKFPFFLFALYEIADFYAQRIRIFANEKEKVELERIVAIVATNVKFRMCILHLRVELSAIEEFEAEKLKCKGQRNIYDTITNANFLSIYFY